MKKRRVRNIDRLYNAARILPMMGKVEDTLKPIMMKKLERLKLPADESKRENFLEGTRGISEKLTRLHVKRIATFASRNVPEIMIEEEMKRFERCMLEVRGVLRICLRSKDPGEYALFMGEKDFNIHRFLDSIGFFLERKVEFQEISEGKKEMRAELLRLAKTREKDGLKKLIEFLKRQFPDNDIVNVYEMAAALTGLSLPIADLLKENHPEESEEIEFSLDGIDCFEKSDMLFGLRRIGLFIEGTEILGELVPFDQEFYAGPIAVYVANTELCRKYGMRGFVTDTEILVESPTPRIVQHELQHVFDHIILGMDFENVEKEYRAILAQILFSKKPDSEYFRLLMKMNTLEIHLLAQKRIIREMSKAPRVADRARELLNEAYRKASGLTYDQILEPFRR
jgi:hypothetical protein